ncbi:sigma-70 family RNA polymerase sigma factor [Roseburia hominis]
MGRDLRQEALTYLLEKADKQGYVTFDDIMDCADANSLPIQDFDWLSSAITTRGILVYDEAPTTSNRIDQDSEDDDYNDYAQSDYEYVYDRIIELDESLRAFVTEVRNIKPPQWKEFSQLKYQVTESNQHARDRMIKMHLRIVLRIALQRAEAYDMDIQDAVGEACIGLVTAVDKYDPDTNGAFGSYAAMWVLQNISRRQPTQRTLMYYPVHKKDPYFSAYPLLKTAGFAGDIDAINNPEVYKLLSEKLSFTNEQTEDAIYATIPFESFEVLYGMFLENFDVFEKHEKTKVNGDLYPRELICEYDIEDEISAVMMREQLLEVLGTLTEREQRVLELRYGLKGGEPKTLEEVGIAFNVTRERVRQIEAKALRKLRHPSRSRKLRDYMDYTPTVKSEDD